MSILYINHCSLSLFQAHIIYCLIIYRLQATVQKYISFHSFRCLHFMVFEICFRKKTSLFWMLWDFFFFSSEPLTQKSSTKDFGIHSESESHSAMSDSLWPHGLYSPWNSPGQNTGVGSLSLLQGIFPTQGLSSDLLHCRWILYQLSHRGSPRILEWVAYPFSSGSSWPRNRTGVSCIAAGFFTNRTIKEVLSTVTTFIKCLLYTVYMCFLYALFHSV